MTTPLRREEQQFVLPDFSYGDYDEKEVQYQVKYQKTKYLSYDKLTNSINIIQNNIEIAGTYETLIKVMILQLKKDKWQQIGYRTVKIVIKKPVPICAVLPRMMKNVTLVQEKAWCIKKESIIKSVRGVSSIIECGKECQLNNARSIVYGRGDERYPCSCICLKPSA